MTIRRRKVWRFVGRSGFAVACISLALFGMTSRYTFGYTRWGILIGASEGYVVVGNGDGLSTGWTWERHRIFEKWYLPLFVNGKVFFPLCHVALLGAACGYVGWKRARCKPHGFCPVCSYDLTGNVSGTCPECGTAVDTSEHAAKPPRDGV